MGSLGRIEKLIQFQLIRTSAHSHIITSSSIHSLHFKHDQFDLLVIAMGIVRLLEVTSEKEGYSLPEACGESALVFFDDIIAVVAGLPFHDCFPSALVSPPFARLVWDQPAVSAMAARPRSLPYLDQRSNVATNPSCNGHRVLRTIHAAVSDDFRPCRSGRK